MTPSPPWVFPGNRILAAWWRQLAPWQPSCWWVGHLCVHHVEAPVLVARTVPLDRLHLLTLTLLQEQPLLTTTGIGAISHLPRQVVCRLLHALQHEGLARASPEGNWEVSDLAKHALTRGEYGRNDTERCLFHFLDRGHRRLPPHFIHLHQPLCIPESVIADWRFDTDLLRACIGQPTSWKQQHRFPTEIQGLIPNAAHDPPKPPAWRNVVLDHPEHLLVVLVVRRTPTEGEQLLGFSIRQEGWQLQSQEPAFLLAEGWPEVFPDLTEEIPTAGWKEAWHTWCQPRNLPRVDVEASSLQPQGYRLQVKAPKRLLDRLRAARSDAIKGEAWLLVGSGPVRRSALLEVIAATD